MKPGNLFNTRCQFPTDVSDLCDLTVGLPDGFLSELDEIK